ncbi:MAG TPA: sigma-70 family RNA polymerase sigma factor [Phycisphaerae bacterium]|nr:sigma-70 family RNA polymerase sigma factor [Phycisphaerae bacterium]HOJ74533.1 sigma-70 family RNA polymerase sigma factor [Phycisphaerae bacterium]HOM52733.1 sigma-70 family RNA polymerase sigma factor [Phycisphaerae bacterium]HON66214.1 sigma-70 family RNA polymerase sigma factor [Phycisphaerae bacterium]HPP28437.1 sigma-70 family RNA polymerase sigma factor [Phycisphaerae bacterium]
MADKSATMPASPIALEDAAAVRQVQDGDMGAFSRLVAKYQDRVVNICWRVCGNLEDAQDLAQETFLQALQKIGSYRFAASFYTWLFRIAVNQALSHRRKSRRVTLSLHDGDGEWPEGAAEGRTPADEEPLARLAARELQQRLLRGLDSLDDDYRAIIVLRDIESLDYQEIAEILEISVGTVKSRLHRARMALREKIKATD